MEKLLKEAKLEKEFSKIKENGVKVVDLRAIITDSKAKAVDCIQNLLPSLKLFDCHKLKATLQDLQKSGKIMELMVEEGSMEKSEMEKEVNLMRNQKLAANTNSKSRNQGNEVETITPDKRDYKSNQFASIDSLKARKRSSFKRREALNKKGWGKDINQLTMDKFLVPKKRKRGDDSRFMMMGCSDSYSYIPSAYGTTSISSRPQYRSRKRINKLVGKQQDGPMTRSRIASKDFTVDDELSYFSTLQDIKKKKRSKLNNLKNNDMFLMSA